MVHKNISAKSNRIPGGLIVIMIWQVLVIIFSLLNLLTLRNVAFLGGTVFGISNVSILQIFFIIVAFISIISFIGILQRFSWGKWLYVISLLTVIIVRIIHWGFIIYSKGFKYFIDVSYSTNEFLILLINLIIIFYLLRGKNVKVYF